MELYLHMLISVRQPGACWETLAGVIRLPILIVAGTTFMLLKAKVVLMFNSVPPL